MCFLYDPRNKSKSKCNQCDHAFAPALPLKKHEKIERKGQKVLDGWTFSKIKCKQAMNELLQKEEIKIILHSFLSIAHTLKIPVAHFRVLYLTKWKLKSLLWESLFGVFCQVTLVVLRPGRESYYVCQNELVFVNITI